MKSLLHRVSEGLREEGYSVGNPEEPGVLPSDAIGVRRGIGFSTELVGYFLQDKLFQKKPGLHYFRAFGPWGSETLLQAFDRLASHLDFLYNSFVISGDRHLRECVLTGLEYNID